MTLNLNFLLALLLIRGKESFRNSYNLCKILAWKFNMIEFTSIINALEKEGLINVEVIKSIGYYEITESGNSYINNFIEQAKPILLKKYIEQQDIINKLC